MQPPIPSTCIDPLTNRPTVSNRKTQQSQSKLQADIQVKVNVNLSLCFFLTGHDATKTYWGSGGIAPRIPDRGIRRRWVELEVYEVP